MNGELTVHRIDSTHSDLVRHPVVDQVGALLAGLVEPRVGLGVC